MGTNTGQKEAQKQHLMQIIMAHGAVDGLLAKQV